MNIHRPYFNVAAPRTFKGEQVPARPFRFDCEETHFQPAFRTQYKGVNAVGFLQRLFQK